VRIFPYLDSGFLAFFRPNCFGSIGNTSGAEGGLPSPFFSSSGNTCRAPTCGRVEQVRILPFFFALASRAPLVSESR